MEDPNYIHELFWACVLLLQWGALKLGISYEALNIWIFVVIHPLITLTFVIAYLTKAAQCRHIKHLLNMEGVKKV